MSGYCFFCGHHLGSAHTTPPATVTQADWVRPSAQSDSLSDLAYVPPEDRVWYWLLLRMKGYTLPMIAARWHVTDQQVFREIKPLLKNPQARVFLDAKRRYQQHREKARQRGIAWAFTFDSWWRVWRESGHYAKRGMGGDNYVMARHADEGPYSPTNVRICTGRENMREAHWRLTPPEVREIRASQAKTAVLAERLGVSRATVSGIRKGKTWTHLL